MRTSEMDSTGEGQKSRTLRDELAARGRLPWAEVVELGARVAAALEGAHAETPPRVHGGLAPEQVKLLPGGAVELLGFGAETAAVPQAAALRSLSPEQLDGKPVDARTDLYALGLVLYEALAGREAFRATSPRELLELQLTAPPPRFDEEVHASLPRVVEELVFALLEKSPAARPASARAVLERLAPLRPAERAPETERLPGAPPRPGDTSSAEAAGAASAPESPPTGAQRSLARRPALSTPRPAEGASTDLARTTAAELPTWAALLIILGLSIVAGLVAYTVRLRAHATQPAPSVTSTTTTRPSELR